MIQNNPSSKRPWATGVLAFLLVLLALEGGAAERRMTNQDVIKMVRAGVSEETILSAIRNGNAGFDTSGDGIVKLSQSRVPESIMQAMIEANANRASATGSSTSGRGGSVAGSRGGMSPDEVVMVVDSRRTSMKYLTPSTRSAARALGFGGVATYAVLSGRSALARTTGRSPSFLVQIPERAQPQSYFTLASFAIRDNGSREVVVGGGVFSYSTGVHKDRVIASTAVREPNQSGAAQGFVLYRISPDQPLQPGEYALILYNSQVPVQGFFVGGVDSYFDFGVD